MEESKREEQEAYTVAIEELLRWAENYSAERKPKDKPKDFETALLEVLSHYIGNIIGDARLSLEKGKLSREEIIRDKERIRAGLNENYPNGLPPLAKKILDMLEQDWTEENLAAVVDKVHDFAMELIEKGKI